MTHDEARSLLAFHEGPASEREAELAAHLAGCPSCRAIADEYRRQDAFLRNLELPEPATGLRPGVFARLGKPRPAWRRFVPLAGLVPLGALFILITILIHPPPANAPLSSAPTARGPITPKNAPEFGPQRPARSRKDSAAPAASPSHGPRGSAQVVADGLMLSVGVDRLSYPRNALVPVTVRLQNVSGHEIAVVGWGYNCQSDLAWAEVMSKDGRVVYPPAYPGEMQPFCPAEGARPFHAGQVVTKRLLVILRGPIVRGVARPVCRDVGSCAQAELRTPPLRLKLSAAERSRVAFHTGHSLTIDVVPKPKSSASTLYVTDSWSCSAGNSAGSLTWRLVPSGRLSLGCRHPRYWAGAAGWLNHSVVTFSYRRKG